MTSYVKPLPSGTQMSFFLKNQLLHKHNFEKKGIVVIFFNRVNDKKIKYQICSAFENVGQ